MKRLLLGATILAAIGASPVNAAQVSVETIGSVLNESLALPAEDTPGSGIAFDQFFEFSLPTTETVTLSMSDSGIGHEGIVNGVFSLNNWASTGPAPLFIPMGSLIESSSVNNVIGGQEATVAPDVLSAGSYFAELAGVSGTSPIHIVIDGTITGTTVPEPSTWALLLIGFGVIGMFAYLRRRDLDMKASNIA